MSIGKGKQRCRYTSCADHLLPLQVVEKDALIQEKEKLYVQLKNIIARLGFYL